MDKFFEELRARIDAAQKRIADLPDEDAVFALGDLGIEVADFISSFAQKAGDALLEEGGSIDDVVIDEPVAVFIDYQKLTEAAVRTLLIRGDMVAQLRGEGFDDLADAVDVLVSQPKEQPDAAQPIAAEGEPNPRDVFVDELIEKSQGNAANAPGQNR